ncbi:MAG: acyl-CoA reductase [Nitrospirota bacterium]
MKAIHQIADRLRITQTELHERPIHELIRAIDAVSKIFLNPSHSLRQEAIACLSQEASIEMAIFAVDDCFQNLRSLSLTALLEEELGDPLVLDSFRSRKVGRGKTRAFGPQLITHILPGNIPSIGVMSLVTAILVKSASLVKISSQRPDLTPFFIRGLQAVSPLLAESVAIISWNNANRSEMTAAFDRSDKVILYGSDETVSTIAPRISPPTKLIVHGSKVSLGLIAKECVSREMAERAAIDVTLYDQRGCLSPHLYYIEAGGTSPAVGENTPILFAEWLADALQKTPFPKGFCSDDAASAIQQLRGVVPLKGGKVFGSNRGVEWTVLYDPDPTFEFSPLSRTIWIKPIQTLLDIGTVLSPIGKKFQAVGVALSESDEKREMLFNQLGLLGVSRICPIGAMQKPPLAWHHDGRFKILDLLRFVDEEDFALQ